MVYPNNTKTMTYINRDPFSRTELHRDLVATKNGCRWCGNTRKSGNLFEYSVQHDSGRTNRIDGYFCSKSCMSIYHDI